MLITEHPDTLEFIKYKLIMRCIRKFSCKVLAGPVLIMFTIPPQAALGYIINLPLVGYPDGGFVITIMHGKFTGSIKRQVCHCLALR